MSTVSPPPTPLCPGYAQKCSLIRVLKISFRLRGFWGGALGCPGRDPRAAQEPLVGDMLPAQGLPFKLWAHTVINKSQCRFILTRSYWFWFGCLWGGWWEANCGCLVVLNFSSFSNVAKACSASAVTGTQMLWANHSRLSWLPPDRPGWKHTGHWEI